MLGNTFYYTGGLANGTTIAGLSTTTSGPGFTGSYSVTGANASCFRISGNNLQTAGSCAAGSYSFNVVATQAGATGSPFTQAVSAYAGQTYYLSSASGNTSGWGNGSDGNNGTSTSTPWLSVNHNVNCGDVILAAKSTTYSGYNFAPTSVGGTGWGTVTCGGNDNVAWLTCASFDNCKFSTHGPEADIEINANYWGVQGFESSNTGGNCFLALPTTAGTNTGSPPTNSSTVHHVAFAQNVVNGCGGDGIATAEDAGGTGPAAVDYAVIIGNVAYASGQQNNECFSNISIGSPGNFDTVATTKFYLSHNLGYRSVDNSTCAGSPATTDGECNIFDTTGQNRPSWA